MIGRRFLASRYLKLAWHALCLAFLPAHSREAPHPASSPTAQRSDLPDSDYPARPLPARLIPTAPPMSESQEGFVRVDTGLVTLLPSTHIGTWPRPDKFARATGGLSDEQHFDRRAKTRSVGA